MPGSPEGKAERNVLQLLGLAFAGADLVFEIGDDGRVTFALGAVEHLTGRGGDAFVGSDWSDLVSPGDVDLLDTLREGLKPGERQGPLRVTLRPQPSQRLGRHASLSVFRLPQAGARISCALSLGGGGRLGDVPRRDDGLLEPDTFAAAAAVLLDDAERAGLPLRLELVELGGLDAAMAAMDAATAQRTRRQVAATLRADSVGGLGASEVATDRFAVVRSTAASGPRLSERLRQACGSGVRPTTVELPLEASAAQNAKAMRYALDRYIEDGPAAAAAGFKATVERTVRDTTRFKSMLSAGAFHLAYQPVIELDRRTLHHFEALARFDANSSPADTIRLAEELDLIADFDLAVSRNVAKALAAAPDLRIAANVSAVSLMQPGFVEALTAITASDPGLRPRLLLEVTETQRLADLDMANAIIGRLRGMGHVVCLDDFGAGAASLDYLRRLDVDIVKIDGRYVQSLDSRPRDALVLKHVVALCRELGLSTIAEMVETRETARLLLDLGVDLGQGWHFGKPLPEPKWTPEIEAPARRAGAVEQWS